MPEVEEQFCQVLEAIRTKKGRKVPANELTIALGFAQTVLQIC